MLDMRRLFVLLLMLISFVLILSPSLAYEPTTSAQPIANRDFYYSFITQTSDGCYVLPVIPAYLPRKGIVTGFESKVPYELFYIPKPEAFLGVYAEVPKQAMFLEFGYCECEKLEDLEQYIREHYKDFYIFTPVGMKLSDGTYVYIYGIGYGVGETEIIPILKKPYILRLIDNKKFYAKETLIPMFDQSLDPNTADYYAKVYFQTDCTSIDSYLYFTVPGNYARQKVWYLFGDTVMLFKDPIYETIGYKYVQYVRQILGSNIDIKHVQVLRGEAPQPYYIGPGVTVDMTLDQLEDKILQFNMEYAKNKFPSGLITASKYTLLDDEHFLVDLGTFDGKIATLGGTIYFAKIRPEEQTVSGETESEEETKTTSTQGESAQSSVQEEETSKEVTPCDKVLVKGIDDEYSITYPSSQPITGLISKICNYCDEEKTVIVGKSISTKRMASGEMDRITVPANSCTRYILGVDYLPYNKYTITYSFGLETKQDKVKKVKPIKEVKINVTIFGERVCNPNKTAVLDLINGDIEECDQGCVRTQDGAKCLETVLPDDITPDKVPKDPIKRATDVKDAVKVDLLSTLMVGAFGTLSLFANEWPLVKDLIPLVPGGLITLITLEVAFIGLTYYLWRKCGAPGSDIAGIVLPFALPFVGDIPFFLYSGGYCLYKKLKGEE